MHLLDRTSELGAILVAGPRARDLLERLTDDPIEAAALPYPGHRELTLAGVPCRAIRSGFVGELAFELHHPRSSGPELWDALLREGRALEISPSRARRARGASAGEGSSLPRSGHAARRHAGQARSGWAVDMAKPWFVGKAALERLAELPPTRRLVGLEFEGAPADGAELRGAPLTVGGAVVGRVTSAAKLRLARARDRPRMDPARRGRVPERARRGLGRRPRRAHAVLRPRGREGPWLSSGRRRRA